MFDKILSENEKTDTEEEDDDTIIDVGKMSPDNRQVAGSNLCQVDDQACLRVSGADSSSEKQHGMVIKGQFDKALKNCNRTRSTCFQSRTPCLVE